MWSNIVQKQELNNIKFVYKRIVSFGGGMIRLPGGTFSRFILMFYILFCLIMRTGYQGKQFEFMTKDMRMSPVKTFNDIIEKNFSIYLAYNLYDTSNEFQEYIPEHQLHVTTVFESQDIELVKSLLIDGSRRAFSMDSTTLNRFKHLANGTILYTRLNDRIMLDHMRFFFFKSDFVFNSFDKIVTRLIESGIADKLVNEYKLHEDEYIEPPDLVVLTLDHLGVGFMIWLGFLGVSTLCFAFEYVLLSFSYRVRNLVWRNIMKCRRMFLFGF